MAAAPNVSPSASRNYVVLTPSSMLPLQSSSAPLHTSAPLATHES